MGLKHWILPKDPFKKKSQFQAKLMMLEGLRSSIEEENENDEN